MTHTHIHAHGLGGSPFHGKESKSIPRAAAYLKGKRRHEKPTGSCKRLVSRWPTVWWSSKFGFPLFWSKRVTTWRTLQTCPFRSDSFLSFYPKNMATWNLESLWICLISLFCFVTNCNAIVSIISCPCFTMAGVRWLTPSFHSNLAWVLLPYFTTQADVLVVTKSSTSFVSLASTSASDDPVP